jgi:hypothetical protein
MSDRARGIVAKTVAADRGWGVLENDPGDDPE